MTLEQQALKVWKMIKSNLEDRSVLHVDDVDDETMAELVAEQVETIAAEFRPVKDPGH
jgi:hypoxanthine-guanine phosphoribosyltransferase